MSACIGFVCFLLVDDIRQRRKLGHTSSTEFHWSIHVAIDTRDSLSVDRAFQSLADERFSLHFISCLRMEPHTLTPFVECQIASLIIQDRVHNDLILITQTFYACYKPMSHNRNSTNFRWTRKYWIEARHQRNPEYPQSNGCRGNPAEGNLRHENTSTCYSVKGYKCH